jgi:hypothetical protein
MKKRILLLSMGFALALTLGIDQDVGAQTRKQNSPAGPTQGQNLTNAAEQAAAERAFQGKMRNVTNAQRREAAARTAARRAAAAAAAEKGGTDE